MSALAWPANVAHYRSRQAFSGLFALHFAPGKKSFCYFLVGAAGSARKGEGERSMRARGERECVCARMFEGE